MRGTVKFFDKSKGWGFITDSKGKDYFIHHSSIVMDGFRSFDEGDIVDFVIGTGTTGRTQAINVIPILTLSMVVNELSKERLHIMRIGDAKGVHGWYIGDKSDNPVIDKMMDLKELAAYVGFDVEGLEHK